MEVGQKTLRECDDIDAAMLCSSWKMLRREIQCSYQDKHEVIKLR